jgi:hypothetical protein
MAMSVWLTVAPKCHFFQDSQLESLKIPKIGTPSTLEGHNFLFRPLIEVRYKVML